MFDVVQYKTILFKESILNINNREYNHIHINH